MIETRLMLIDPEFVAKLRRADEKQLRAVAQLACCLAIRRCQIAEPVVDLALHQLTVEHRDNELRAKIEAFVDELDEQYFDAKDRWENGEGREEAWSDLFQKARAVHSLYFALADDPFEAATEALYEANAAVENWHKLSTRVVNIMASDLK